MNIAGSLVFDTTFLLQKEEGKGSVAQNTWLLYCSYEL